MSGRSSSSQGEASASAVPTAAAIASEMRAATPRRVGIARAHVPSDARDGPHLERRKHAPDRPLDRAAELHRRERRLAVSTEHDAVDDEHERLQQRMEDRRQREAPHLGRERAQVAQLTIRSL